MQWEVIEYNKKQQETTCILYQEDSIVTTWWTVLLVYVRFLSSLISTGCPKYTTGHSIIVTYTEILATVCCVQYVSCGWGRNVCSCLWCMINVYIYRSVYIFTSGPVFTLHCLLSALIKWPAWIQLAAPFSKYIFWTLFAGFCKHNLYQSIFNSEFTPAYNSVYLDAVCLKP